MNDKIEKIKEILINSFGTSFKDKIEEVCENEILPIITEEYSLSKRKAIPGEFIMITDPFQFGGESYKKGDIFKVSKDMTNPRGIFCSINKRKTFIYHNEYSVMTNYKKNKGEVKNEFFQ